MNLYDPSTWKHEGVYTERDVELAEIQHERRLSALEGRLLLSQRRAALWKALAKELRLDLRRAEEELDALDELDSLLDEED